MGHVMSGAFGIPLETGAVQTIDPLALEPGIILFDRFCVLEPPRILSSGAWEVSATDVHRSFGGSPHHRVNLIALPGSADLRKIRAALAVSSEAQTQPLASVPMVDGLVVVAPPRPPPMPGRLARGPWTAHALDLASLLSQYHDAGVIGIDLDPANVHFDGTKTTVYGYAHLLRPGTPERDVARLLEYLAERTDEDLPTPLRKRPTSAAELWERCRMLGTPEPTVTPRALPTLAPFVGRQDVLDLLTRRCDQARRGDASVVVVESIAGGGKTRLLQQLSVVLDRWMDTVVLAGSFQIGVPFRLSGFAEAMQDLAHVEQTLPEGERDALRTRVLAAAGPLAGILSALSPALARWLGTHPMPPELESDKQFLRHAAILSSIVRVIGTPKRPLVVILDNAHLADPTTVEVLRNLCEEPTPHHTAVVLAGWPDMPAGVLRNATERFTLGPLQVSEIADLLRASVPGPLRDPVDDARRLRQVTDGWPLQTWVTLQSWVQNGRFAPSPVSGEWGIAGQTPDSTELVELYSRQFERLKPHELWVAVVVALRPGRVAATWIEGVTNWGTSEVERAILGMTRVNMLVLDPGGHVRFPHDSVREFILDKVSPDVVARAHQQIGAWLKEHSPAEKAHYTWHIEHATLPGPSEALAWDHVESGRTSLDVYDLERADWHFKHAVARATEASTQLAAREGMAHVDLLSGRVTNALRVYEEVVAASDDPVHVLRVAARAANGLYRKSNVENAIQLASQALARTGEPWPATRAGLVWAIVVAVLRLMWPWDRTPAPLRDAYCQLYVALITAMATDPMMVLLSILRGRRNARGLETGSASMMLSFYAAFRAAIGGAEAGRSILTEAERIAEISGEDMARGARAHIYGQNELAEGNYEVGCEALDASTTYHLRAGDDSTAVLSLMYKAIYGRDREAIATNVEVLREAEAAAIRADTFLWRTTIAALQLLLRARRGDNVAGTLDALATHCEDAPSAPDLTLSRMYLALAFVEIGDIPSARHQVDHLTRTLPTGAGQLEILIEPLVAVIEVLLLDDSAANARTIRRALKSLSRAGRTSPRLKAAWLFYSGRVAAARKDRNAAIVWLRELVNTLPMHHQNFLAFRAHTMLADLEFADQEASSRHATRAIRLARQLGLRQDKHLPELEAARDPETVDAPVVPSSPDDAPAVEVAPLIQRLLPALEHALPSQLRFTVNLNPDVRAGCVAEQLQLLVVNLVLAARDALTGSGEIELTIRTVERHELQDVRVPLANGHPYVEIEVRGHGFHASESISGLGVCCEITAGMGGFMNVGDAGPDTLVLTAFVPAPASGGIAVRPLTGAYAEVVHPDPRVRSTLVSALQQLGYRVSERAALEDLRGGPTDIVFADDSLLVAPHLGWGQRTVIRLVPRGARSPSTPQHPTLRVPFAIGELTAILERAAPGPTETESPTG